MHILLEVLLCFSMTFYLREKYRLLYFNKEQLSHFRVSRKSEISKQTDGRIAKDWPFCTGSVYFHQTFWWWNQFVIKRFGQIHFALMHFYNSPYHVNSRERFSFLTGGGNWFPSHLSTMQVSVMAMVIGNIFFQKLFKTL